MVDGRWSMVDGRWSMVDGRWSMVDGRWSRLAYWETCRKTKNAINHPKMTSKRKQKPTNPPFKA
ncbi:hypothetical protein C3737_04355 [Aeromonas jandaei]|nr:hypothetical protein C3737_04355 [Aeromonas jandaei]